MARRQQIIFCTELYLGRPVGDLYQLSLSSYERNLSWDPEEITFNMCYSIVNTIRNRICSFRPRAQFLPNGGDYKATRTARDLTDGSDAWAHKIQYQSEASLMFRDLLIGDGGVLKIGIDGDKVTAARFPEWEFLFDEAEGIYRVPECAYHVTYLPVDQASVKYQMSREQLSSAAVTSPLGITYSNSRQLVRIVEAWKRKDEALGRRIVVVGNNVVPDEDEEWDYDGHPLVVRTFDEGQVGVWGTGAVAALADLQLELNDVHLQMREAHRMSSMQRIAVQENEAAPSKVTNATVAIDRFKNQAPVYQAVQPMHGDWYQYAAYLKQLGYETLGISPSMAAGVKEPGLTAAVAIQESTELQQDRLALLSQLWETGVVETAEWWRRFEGMLAADGVVSKFRSIGRGGYRDISFPADNSAETEIRVYPSSIFGSTAAGRLERANFLIDKGWLSKEEAMKAADVPDLSPIIDLQLAPQYAMEMLCDDCLELGKFQQPPPYLDAGALFTYARSRWLLAFASQAKYPLEHMAALSKLIDAVDPTNPLNKPPAAPLVVPQVQAGPTQLPPPPDVAIPTGPPLPGSPAAPGGAPPPTGNLQL